MRLFILVALLLAACDGGRASVDAGCVVTCRPGQNDCAFSTTCGGHSYGMACAWLDAGTARAALDGGVAATACDCVVDGVTTKRISVPPLCVVSKQGVLEDECGFPTTSTESPECAGIPGWAN